jgi:hypothetical protein
MKDQGEEVTTRSAVLPSIRFKPNIAPGCNHDEVDVSFRAGYKSRRMESLTEREGQRVRPP